MTSRLNYRRAEFRPVPPLLRAWPLARLEAVGLFRTRWGIALFFVCLLPGLIRLAMLLLVFGVIQFGPLSLRNRLATPAAREVAALDPFRVEFYVEPVLQVMPGMVFALLLTTLVAARTVAKDRATNALELYWTRGITPIGYLVAKWVGATLLVATITVAVPLALWVTAVLLADDWTLLTTSAWPMLRALAALGLFTGVWTAIAVLASLGCRQPNTAMVVFCMLVVGSAAIGFVASRVLRTPELHGSLSLWHAGGVVARAMAGLPQRGVSVGGSIALLGGLVAGLAWRARARLRVAAVLS
ncbi:MAG: hypothetical protein JNK15_09235 [Planctomycetes bacterium]|nr:hypothetical protein [Planctomycetota bacterium]